MWATLSTPRLHPHESRWRLLWIVAAPLLSATIARAQSTSGTPHGAASEAIQGPRSGDTTVAGHATLIGHVMQLDTVPIGQAVVVLSGTRDSVLTLADGSFAFHDAPAGAHLLTVRRVGFRLQRFAITLTSGEPRDVTILLDHAIPVLPTVRTTAEQVRVAYHAIGLDQRMEVGVGQFLTYDQIVARQAKNFSQLLSGMRGIRMWHENHSFGTTVEGTRGAGSCVSYEVDGVPQLQLMDQTASVGGLPQSIQPESPDNLFDPSEIGAIEVYSSAARPAGFGGPIEHPNGSSGDAAPKVDMNGQQCVLVVIWTRARLGITDAPNSKAPPEPTQASLPDATIGRAIIRPAGGCSIPLAEDTVDLGVYVSVQGSPPRATADSVWAAYRQQVLDLIVRGATLPTELLLPAFGVPFETEKDVAIGRVTGQTPLDITPTLSTVVALDLDSAGQLASADIASSSLSGGADTTVLALVDATSGGLPPLPVPDRGVTSTRLYVLAASLPAAPVNDQAATIGHLEVPAWRLTHPAEEVDSPTSTHVNGPGVAPTAGVEMVLSEEGKPIPSTTRIVGFDPPGSTRVVPERELLQLLSQHRYKPAMIGKCDVPALVIESVPLLPSRAPSP